MPSSPLGSTVLTTFSVTAPSGATLHGLVHRPLQALRRRRLPAVVLSPGGVGAGRMMARGPVGTRLAQAGMVVVSFNAEGRKGGRLDVRSGGRLDFNGPRDQDGLAAVVRHALTLPDVDPERLGLASVSYGLVAVAGCVSRHPALPVQWIADEEGPADCTSAMLMGWRVHDLGERPDRAQKALDLFGHPCPADARTPAAARAAEAFWGEREPVRLLAGWRRPYLRLQAEYDHVQPPQEPAHVPLFDRPPAWWQGRHAMQLVNTLVAGGCPWVRVNLPAHGNAVNATYTQEAPPRWIPGRMADHGPLLADAILELVGRTGAGPVSR